MPTLVLVSEYVTHTDKKLVWDILLLYAKNYPELMV